MSNTNRIGRQKRLERVSELIANGYANYEIVDICSKEWNTTDRTAYRYIAIVYDFLKRELNHNDKEKILVEYDKLIKKYELKGDSKTAMAYRFQRDKILGLSTEKVNIKVEEIKIKLPRHRDEEND